MISPSFATTVPLFPWGQVHLESSSHTLSTHMAMPIPPPMHREATPLLPPSLCSACKRVTSTLQPDIPMGCPREMAPPLTFTCRGGISDCTVSRQPLYIKHNWMGGWGERTLSGFRPSALTTAIDWAANASLISYKSTWSSCHPALSTCNRQGHNTGHASAHVAGGGHCSVLCYRDSKSSIFITLRKLRHILSKVFFLKKKKRCEKPPHENVKKILWFLPSGAAPSVASSHRFPDGPDWPRAHDRRVEANLSKGHNLRHGLHTSLLRLRLTH